MSLNALLKKTEHYDKDERYMATSDLCTALQRHAAAIGSGSVGGGPVGGPPGGPGPTTHYSHHQTAAHSSHATAAMAVPIDASMERRICTAILALLDDDSNDVQAIAVKTLGVLLTTVHEEQVLEICDRLVGLVLDESKTDLRDVYTIGLRTLVKTVPPSMGNGVSARLVPRLIGGIRSDAVVDVKLAALDVLTDLLARFGSSSPSVANEHERILNVLLSQLSSPSAVVKKRAGGAIGCLAVVVGDGLLHRLVDTLLAQINLYDGRKKRKAAGGAPPAMSTRSSTSAAGRNGDVADEEAAAADTRALIRTMCTISGTVGHRLANQIDRIVPIFLRFCDPADAVTGDDRSCDDESMEEGDDGDSSGMEGGGNGDEAATALANELRESCFAGFESFVLRCPAEIQPHIPKIIEAALAYMRYDPNYSYGDEDEDGEGEGGGSDIDDDDDEFDDDEDEGFSDDDLEDVSDDDDDSWKVRRSAIRALAAIVDAMKADPSKLWTEYGVAAALVKRFKEREENCRVDVIDCFTRLLAITVASPAAGKELENHSPTTSTGGDAMDISPSSMSMDIGDDDESVVSKFIPAIVSACEKQLKAKRGGERTKSSALALLSTACLAPGGIGGADQIGKVFGHVGAILKEPGGSKSLKLDALSLVRIVLSCDRHDPADVRSCLALLLPDLCHAVQEDWYKVIAEALRVLSEVPRIATAAGGDDPTLSPSTVGAQLFDAIQPRLAAHDLDQEIKECSLSATAALLSMHTHLTQSQREVLLTLILERLRNEITRLAALKTLSVVAAAGSGPGDSASVATPIDLSCILGDAVSELASLLRQQSRGLKQSSLETLRVLVTGHGVGMDIALCEQVLRESGSIISDSDLHISHLSLRVSISVLKACPSSASLVQTHILPPALVLSTSPLLQDLALESLLSLLEEVVVSNVVPFPELHADLKGRLPTGNDGVISKPSISNLAKCIAVTTCATTKGNRDTVVKELVANLNSPDIDDVNLQLSLLTSGEIGQRTDLNQINGVASELQKVYLRSFESSNEETKAAAAYALGRAAVGSMSAFLPAILDALENSTQKKQYLLLSAIKEIIKCHQMSGRDLTLSLPVVLPHLVSHFAAKEEGVRTMVAECIGSLCCLKPREILPKLQELTAAHCGKSGGGAGEDEDDVSEDALVCWTVATAVKFAISHRAPSSELLPFMPSFLALLNEQDLSVRLAALLMVYASVHHTPQLLSGLMREHVLPALYELAQLNLKRVVDLGPFKHTVDDALPLRKASLSIFATSLENCPASLDIPAFMPILAKALEDVEDVQLQAHHIVISMCLRHPEPILTAADTFVDPLEKTINKKKGNKTGTELERANEWIKSGLRVMLALSHVDGAMSSRKFADFVERTKKNAKFQPFLEMLEEER